MTKLDLINGLKEKAGISKQEAASVVDLFFGQMSDALPGGDRVEIRGLCSFYVKEYGAYMARNPKTGERVPVSPKNPSLNADGS